VRVPEVVQPDPPDAGSLDDPLESLAERVRVDGAPVLPARDEILILIVAAPLRALVVLSPTIGTEQLDGLSVQVDHPSVVALRRRLQDLIRHRDNRMTNRQARRIEINIGPAQSEDLIPTHSPHGREAPYSSEA
jgi:hypothetical protein